MSVRGTFPSLFASVFTTIALLACASERVAPAAAPTEAQPGIAPHRPPHVEMATAHRERHCSMPKRDAEAPAPSSVADGGLLPVASAEKAIVSLRPSFRDCFQRGLASDPAMDGCAILQVHLTRDGSVASAESVVEDGLSPGVIGCLESVLRHAAFDAPGGSGATLNVPLRFEQLEPPPPPPRLVAPGPPPTAPMPNEVAGFRFGMTVAEFEEHCRQVGRPNPLVGDNPKLRDHTCDGVEVEPGMRLNVYLGFCQGDSRLCEISYWTNHNAARAYRIFEAKLVARYGNAPVQNGDLHDETLDQQCAVGEGKVRRTWWWGPESAPTGRVLLALECKGAQQSVGVYFDDPLGTAAQIDWAKQKGP